MEKLSHSSENVLDRFREKTLAPTDKIINLILEIIDFLRNALNSIENGQSPNIPATPGLVSLLKDYSGAEKDQKNSESEKKDVVEKRQEKQAEKKKPVEKQVEKQDVKDKEEDKKPKPVKKEIPKAPPTKKSSSVRQSVRVDVEKLDVLLDLVGELVIAEAMVAQNPDLKGIDASLERFERAAMQLNKITRDLQDIANSIRMIPLAGTFRRMVRLVRDLSQKANKKVDLKIVGEDTEVDKTVIEQITDPLIHIIRNSLDHGLETPDDRKKVDKNPTGTLLLEAKYVGGEVWITIEDDGRGLNREKILNRAIERELISGDPNDLPDEQVWQFIFHPGFSTAEKITDVSGRGVGMDVVKRNIENTRGKVDIKSNEGKGTQVILRIPLTLAIIDGMLVKVGEERYTIPITAIRESLQIEPGMVTETMDGQEIIRVREELIPVVRLHSLFSVPTEVTKLEEGIITIVENDGNTVCLYLDEVLEQQQIVIKGMSDYIGNHECVSGCTILGDGDISLILDIAGIIEFARNNTRGKGDSQLKEMIEKEEL
jgi:two-component system chemotaxis sensor kinase CheA